LSQRLSNDCKSKGTVLHLIDTTGPGGAEAVFTQLADLMRRRGYRSVVVIRGEGWVCEQLNRHGIKPVILNAKGSFNIRFLWALTRLIRSKNVSVIHSHLLGSNVYAAIAGLLTRRPVVATYHGMVDISPNERFRAIKMAVMRRGIKQYALVSNGLMQYIKEKGLLDPARTSIVYNGVDVTQYEIDSRNTIRLQLGLSEKAFLVGSLGNVRQAKAYDVLIKSAAIVVEDNPEVHFVIAGDKKCSLMNTLEDQIKALGIQKNIHFVGYCEDSAAFLVQMDLFLLSSTSEGFSISTIEAMAAGLTVLATRCGGPEEIIEHNVNGVLVETNNADEIADAVVALMTDSNKCNRLSKAGKKRAEDCFGLEKMLSNYDNIYQALNTTQ
jgi:glycosyltransferase involved in cell wall biosynthesis